jgi:diaminohydroxyphosphoribosylaminopyrimidine deaminase/5-amino-6-(5-phosphoribosylamino)uracil reductase
MSVVAFGHFLPGARRKDEKNPHMSQHTEELPPLTTEVMEFTMRRAKELAGRGPARGVNPQVGCVVLNPTGEVIAEGWHRGSGTPHAEVDALSKLTAEQAKGSTFVVSLEPCNHTGKTGPCAQALISANVARVIYAATDPGHSSAGGADTLRRAGIDVTGGVLESEVNEQLHDWMRSAQLGRPFVTLKWAASLDGRAAADDGTSQWISGEEARERVHVQRSQADAIVVGTGTVLADNPSLTARTPEGQLHEDQPMPVVIGERPIPSDSLVYWHPHAPLVTGHRDIEATLVELRAKGVRSVFVEGGPTLASAFIAAGVVDRFYIYLAPVLLGGDKLALTDLGIGTLADRLKLELLAVERLGSDIFIEAQPVPHASVDAPQREEF